MKTGQYFFGNDHAALSAQQSGSTCTMQNADIATCNMSQRRTGGSLWTFTYPTSGGDGINGTHSPTNDAHPFGGGVHDRYDNWFGAPPLAFQLRMNVHYSRNYENAFWNGSSMNFGDGASYFFPLVSLDVTSHEISHGLTEQHSNLAYSGQSSGMNEAFSDMAGEAAEYYDRGSNDWLVGAEIIKKRHRAALEVHADARRSLDRQRRQLHIQPGRALLQWRLQQGVLHAGEEVDLDHAQGVRGIRTGQRAVLDIERHVQLRRLRCRERSGRSGLLQR